MSGRAPAILKLGHTDPRFDGEPAAGWLANMATANDGHSLVADFVGMPGWLGPILASAFPDRSIEGQWDYRCAIGHNHGFVLTGLALLGVAHPAIGTLASLQDVGRMYGVELSDATDASGRAFTIDLKGPPAMSKTTTVAATVSTEDVRRAYYDDAPWELWIEEISLEPLQLIVVNDETGERLRVPVIVDPDGNGADGVEFGTPVAVVVRYEDVTPAASPAPAAAPADGEAVAASASQTVRYASRTESRPDRPVAASTPAAAADGPSEGASVVEITNEDLAALRTALGLDDTADLAAIIAAVTETLAALRAALGLEDTADGTAIVAAVEALAAAAPEGTEVAAAAGSVVSIDREAFASLQRDAKLGRAAHERQESEAREKVVDDAIQLGKIPPSRRAHWLTLMSNDAKGTADTLAGIPNETAFPIAERGHSVTPEVSAAAGGDLGWFNTAPTKEA